MSRSKDYIYGVEWFEFEGYCSIQGVSKKKRKKSRITC